MKKRKMLRRLLADHDRQVQILSTIIIEMIRSGSHDGDDGDSGGTPDLKLELKHIDLIKPETPVYHQ